MYTTDGADLKHLNKGKIPGVYATVDFGSGQDPSKKFGEQKKVEPHGTYLKLVISIRVGLIWYKNIRIHNNAVKIAKYPTTLLPV